VLGVVAALTVPPTAIEDVRSRHLPALSTAFGIGVGIILYVVRIRPRLRSRPTAVLFVENMEIETLDRQLAAAPEADTVVGIGGGQVIDLAKYIAWKRGLRLVSVPSILSVDTFVTPAAGIRRGHRGEYVGQTSPDPLVFDDDLIRTAPPGLNIAGVGDLGTAC
jgi:glycerol dehydrogenase-like iron-containing ADH family enzyme